MKLASVWLFFAIYYPPIICAESATDAAVSLATARYSTFLKKIGQTCLTDKAHDEFYRVANSLDIIAGTIKASDGGTDSSQFPAALSSVEAAANLPLGQSPDQTTSDAVATKTTVEFLTAIADHALMAVFDTSFQELRAHPDLIRSCFCQICVFIKTIVVDIYQFFAGLFGASTVISKAQQHLLQTAMIGHEDTDIARAWLCNALRRYIQHASTEAERQAILLEISDVADKIAFTTKLDWTDVCMNSLDPWIHATASSILTQRLDEKGRRDNSRVIELAHIFGYTLSEPYAEAIKNDRGDSVCHYDFIRTRTNTPTSPAVDKAIIDALNAINQIIPTERGPKEIKEVMDKLTASPSFLKFSFSTNLSNVRRWAITRLLDLAPMIITTATTTAKRSITTLTTHIAAQERDRLINGDRTAPSLFIDTIASLAPLFTKTTRSSPVAIRTAIIDNSSECPTIFAELSFSLCALLRFQLEAESSGLRSELNPALLPHT